MIINHRSKGPWETEYTMAMDRVEFIAIQCAVRNAFELIKEGGATDAESVRLMVVFGAMDVQLHNMVNER